MGLKEYEKYGNAAERLAGAIRARAVSHAYIFEGPPAVDKTGFAKAFAKAVLCSESPGEGCDSCLTCRKIDSDNYEDLYQVHPTFAEKSKTKSIKDDDVKTLQGQLNLIPTGGDRNIAIIEDGELMTPGAQNHLLKTLEEPPVGTVLMILTENAEGMLPTILSRCQRYSLKDREGEPEDDSLAAEIFQMITGGTRFFDIYTRLDQELKNRPESVAFLDSMERVMSARLREDDRSLREFLIHGVDCVEEARKKMNRGLRHSYVIREMIIKMEEYR